MSFSFGWDKGWGEDVLGISFLLKIIYVLKEPFGCITLLPKHQNAHLQNRNSIYSASCLESYCKAPVIADALIMFNHSNFNRFKNSGLPKCVPPVSFGLFQIL